jgi:alpha-amylase/alpha-mannosidase (GH57 family)
MGSTRVAFLWHFHQPCYRDLLTGKLHMPWVRLHGLKDYTGMANLLAEFPRIRCTANFSGVLLDQLAAYGEGATDTMLDLALVPAADLTEDQRSAILGTFFFAHPESVIGRYPRYRELLEMQRSGRLFREQDLRDLQVLANLAWLHPTSEAAPELRRKGRGYAEADKEALLAATREALAAIVPKWKAMEDRVEISVSPHFHPIVPLLCDFASAREAIPGLPLPDAPSFRDEAEVQVRRALETAERTFGRRPEGMWPSEGSVSEEACALFSRLGVRWVATDQAIVGEPGVKRLNGLSIAFRDTELSNLLSFTYKTMDPEEAARDFVRRLEEREGDVPVILDGENPWEHYPDGAAPFLRALFRALSEHPTIRTATIGELEAGGTIDRLTAGSWINRNFGIWIGHPEDRRGWEILGRARLALEGRSDPLAWDCLRAAEGSDWYWWFGEDFTSAQDMEFDALFRRHVANVYRVLGRPIPDEVQRPVKQARGGAVFRPPSGLLSVRLDGRATHYFEWAAAGHYDMGREYGAIAGESAFISDVRYGFDLERFYLRLDFRRGVEPREALAQGQLRLSVTRPRPAVVPLEGVADAVFEAAVPFASLGVRPDEDVEFFLEFERPGGVPVRIPTLVPLAFRVPSSDYETIHWQV